MRSFFKRERDEPADGSATVAALLEASPDAYLCHAEDGTIRYANRRARELFFDGADPSGWSFLRLLGQAPPVLREALVSGQDALFTVELDGWPESYHLVRSEVSWAGVGGHTAMIVRRMTHQVSRRDASISRRVVRLISHEVNNSLSPIQSLARSVSGLLERDAPREKIHRALSTIAERAGHLSSFISAYAELARLPEPKPLRQPWGPLLGRLKALYPWLEVPEPGASLGFFDAVLMEQVLVNLVKNALEAGSAPDAVSLCLENMDGGGAELRLEDRGQGFSEDARRQATLPLYTTKPSGSGLGLTLCREVVEAHGGSLGLSNRAEGGALVRIVLPGPDAGPNPELSRSRLTLTRS